VQHIIFSSFNFINAKDVLDGTQQVQGYLVEGYAVCVPCPINNNFELKGSLLQ